MRWTLITGGAQRLGKEVSRNLSKSGRNIVVHYRTSENEASELVQQLGGRAEMIQGDFSSIKSTQAFLDAYLKRFIETEGLVYNVGNYCFGSAADTKPEVWSALFQENLISCLHLVQGLLPSLKKTKGRIVTIGMAGCSSVRANTHATAYNTTKLSLCMLTKSLAKELGPDGVCVNMVSPGYMEESIDQPSDQGAIPMARQATFEEVARAVDFLMDPANGYITGQNLEVAGGTRL